VGHIGVGVLQFMCKGGGIHINLRPVKRNEEIRPVLYSLTIRLGPYSCQSSRGGSFREIELSRLSSAKPAKV
jgi:hypothetical protein